jgi:transcriptional regulator with XRE-family HTH domain
MDGEPPEGLQEDLARVGARLRRLRKERGWRLEDLAKRTTLSVAYLSRIESGERQPSLTALFAIAQVYGVPFSDLFEPEPEAGDCTVVRAAENKAHRGRGLLYSRLTRAGLSFNLRPLRVVIPADRDADVVYQHEGEQWMYVLFGRLRLELGSEEFVLEAGDAAHFDSSKAHRLQALGGHDAEAIIVACAVPYHVLRTYL